MGRAIGSAESGEPGRAVGDLSSCVASHPGSTVNMPLELQAMLGMLSAEQYLAALPPPAEDDERMTDEFRAKCVERNRVMWERRRGK